MTNEEFIQFLHKPEIRQVIIDIFADDEAKLRMEEKTESNCSNYTFLKEIDDLKEKLSIAQNALTDANEQIKSLKECHDSQENELSDIKESLKLAREKSKLMDSVEAENRKLKAQLGERFSRGWDLFEEYKKVSLDNKKRLSGTFVDETSFMSFICGGAQTDSLENLWDVIRKCVMNGMKEDAEILWDIFEYSVQLVNSTRIQAQYVVFDVKEGDIFDTDIHTETPGSLAQGKVCNVYLPGFKNTYSKKIIRKSLVQVG